MKITKIKKTAFDANQNRKKIDKNEKDVKDLKKDLKSLSREVKKAVQLIDSLNIGQRRFWQHTSVFNSLQRKIERLEKVEGEWKKYKKEMDAKVKRLVEQKSRASIQ